MEDMDKSCLRSKVKLRTAVVGRDFYGTLLELSLLSSNFCDSDWENCAAQQENITSVLLDLLILTFREI